MAFLGRAFGDLGLTPRRLERTFWNTDVQGQTFINKYALIHVYNCFCVLRGLFFTAARLDLEASPLDTVVSPSIGSHVREASRVPHKK